MTSLTAVSTRFAPTPARQRSKDSARPVSPEDMFALASQLFLEGEKLDMNQLAIRLGIGRATLYRWIGDRERLLTDVLWSILQGVVDHSIRRNSERGQKGLVAMMTTQMQMFANAQPLRNFIKHEGHGGLQLITHPDGIHGRLTKVWVSLVEAEVEAGHYRPPTDIETLVDAAVCIGEHFLYSNLIGGFQPKTEQAMCAIRLLLREDFLEASGPNT